MSCIKLSFKEYFQIKAPTCTCKWKNERIIMKRHNCASICTLSSLLEANSKFFMFAKIPEITSYLLQLLQA